MADSSDDFSEAAFDDALDRLWLRFRYELAERLDALAPESCLAVYALWTELLGPQPGIHFHRDPGRLLLSIATADLYPYGPEDRARRDLLITRGWRSVQDETCILAVGYRQVDDAAMAAQHAFRDVWDVPDPSYLVADQDAVVETFVVDAPPRREPKMR